MPAAVSYWRIGKRSGGSLLPTQGTARPAPAVPSVMPPRIPQAGMGAGRAPHQSSWGDTPHRLPLPQLSPPRAGRGPRDTKTMLCWGAGSREDSGAVATSVTPTGHGAQPAAEERAQRYRQMTTFIPHHVLRYWYIELPTELPKSTSPASPLPKIPTERSLQTELGLPMPSRWWLVSHLDDSIRDQLNLAIRDFVQVPRSILSLRTNISTNVQTQQIYLWEELGLLLTEHWGAQTSLARGGSFDWRTTNCSIPQGPPGCLLEREAAYPATSQTDMGTPPPHRPTWRVAGAAAGISPKVSSAPELCPGSRAWMGWAARRGLTHCHLLFSWDGGCQGSARSFWNDDSLSRKENKAQRENWNKISMEKEDFHFKPVCLASLGVLSCSEKRKSLLYWTQFHSSLLLLMKTHSWGFFLHQHLCVCSGNGKVPFNQMKYCSCL